MSFQDFMNKVRYWDNITAKWILRHFYLLFFQIVLVCVFLVWFINTLNVIDTSVGIPKESLLERILAAQSVNLTIVVLLVLLNSFWLLYMFSGVQRIINLLKDMNFNLSRFRPNRDKN